jgi:predicted RNase H-like nuclease (RuvC/YqgF family)
MVGFCGTIHIEPIGGTMLGYTLVGSDELKKLKDECDRLDSENIHLMTKVVDLKDMIETREQSYDEMCAAARLANDELATKLDSAQEEINRLKETMARMTEKNSVGVNLTFDQSLTSVTPIITYNEEATEALFEMGVIKDGADISAVQIGLLLVAHEALTQIVDAFSEDIQ